MENLEFTPTCCFYPSTVLLLDDNPDLLKDISFALISARQKYKSKYSTSPQEIIQILEKQGNTIQQFLKKCMSESEKYYEPSKSLLNIDISAIPKQIYATPPRFTQHLVLVVDFAMPDMSGLELCQKIRRGLQVPIKIIMLTGEADQKTAIQAFNDKLIDRFIVKSSPDYIKVLLKYLHELHIEYFSDISHSLIELIPSFQNTLHKDSDFVKFFNQIIQQYNAIEYYMFDDSGSYLFLDADKKITRLIIKNKEDMRSLLDLAENDPSTPAEVTESIKKKKKLMYFPNEKSSFLPAKEWRLLDAKLLPRKEKGYYSIIEGIEEYPLKVKNIVSYQEFLNKKSST